MNQETTKIICHCCGSEEVEARLTNGYEIYPHREDLWDVPFWIHDKCGNYVGCHHKAASNKTKPLGSIVSKEVKAKRLGIHKVLDPLWKSKKYNRNYIYQWLSAKIGYSYHTGNVKTVEEADLVKSLLKEFVKTHEYTSKKKKFFIRRKNL